MTAQVPGGNPLDYKVVSEYTSLFDIEKTINVYCGLYETQNPCKNPQRKCKNCSVYNGFKGNGKI